MLHRNAINFEKQINLRNKENFFSRREGKRKYNKCFINSNVIGKVLFSSYAQHLNKNKK